MSLLNNDMTQVVEILPLTSKKRINLFYIVNIMGADIMATQGAGASATMIFTIYYLLTRLILSLHVKG